MATRDGYVVLHGSERRASPREKLVGDADVGEALRVTLILRRATPLAPGLRVRSRLKRDAFVRRFGAADDDIAAVSAFAAANGLHVDRVDRASRAVALSGTVGGVAQALDMRIVLYEIDGRTYRGPSGAVHVPLELDGVVLAVLGLDDRPLWRPLISPVAGGPGSGLYTNLQLAQAYDFPQLDGSGQTVAIVEFGGGFKQADLDLYFSTVGLATPSVEVLSVDGGTNSPSPGSDEDLECALDIEVVGSVAPQASIVVYFAPDSDQGWYDALAAAIQGGPCAVSMSWGSAEKVHTAALMTAMDALFQDAGALGVTVCIASGDTGSGDSIGDGKQHVNFPASSPHVLACGGTTVTLNSNGAITSEVVWNDSVGSSGGGVSDFFPLPEWQYGVGVPPSVNPGHFAGRGVPDVAGHASGCLVAVDGSLGGAAGTSAVAPLWAGLVALMSQYLGGGNVGFLNERVSSDPSAVATFHDIVSGNNGKYFAGTGWDACTGWGSPDGAALLDVFGTLAFAEVQIQFD
jgi:kumamolisin